MRACLSQQLTRERAQELFPGQKSTILDRLHLYTVLTCPLDNGRFVSTDSEARQARAGRAQREETKFPLLCEWPTACTDVSIPPARSLYPLTVRHGKHAQDVHKERERSSHSCVHGLQRAQTCQTRPQISFLVGYGALQSVGALFEWFVVTHRLLMA